MSEKITYSKSEVRSRKRGTAAVISALCLLSSAFVLLPSCSRQSSSGTVAREAAKTIYRCPMHPQVTADKPGDCPICGMRLVPVEQAAPEEGGPDAKRSGTGEGISGQAVVNVAAGREQLIGLKSAPVEMKDLFQTVRASARVAYDPNLYSALLEHQEALSALRKSQATGNDDFIKEAQSTVRASRLRLRQMGISESQIQQGGEPGFDPSNLLLGQAGGKVWVYVDLYENEARSVKTGHRVELKSNSYPGKVFEGTVRGIDQVVNAETRTLRARAEAANPNGELKPEMYLNAVVFIPIGRRLAVPESAIMDTGTRKLAFVITAPGRYEPRDVTVGHEAGGFYEILAGLKEGEQVVTSANFLIDSESKIRAAAQGSGQ